MTPRNTGFIMCWSLSLTARPSSIIDIKMGIARDIFVTFRFVIKQNLTNNNITGHPM
jgi:hypothetical protein